MINNSAPLDFIEPDERSQAVAGLIDQAAAEHWGIEKFAPFWTLLTNGCDPLETEMLFEQIRLRLPWISTTEAIDALEAEFSPVLWAMAPGPDGSDHSVDDCRDLSWLTKEQAEAFWAYLETLRRQAEREEHKEGQKDVISGASRRSDSHCVGDARMAAIRAQKEGFVDMPTSSFEGLAELLEDYFTVSGVEEETADLRLAYVIRFGHLPNGVKDKIVFKGCAGDASYFATRFFSGRVRNVIDTFNECFVIIKNGKVLKLGTGSKGKRTAPAVLEDSDLKKFLAACGKADGIIPNN